ncbi:MAG: hypothetical protein Q7K45_03805 [Nanoarchaeota archaeon]|nr:hypothetical protein [Nanoarchaeota archaeon]
MYHNQQPTDGRSPSILENHLTTSYSLTNLVSSTSDFAGRNFEQDRMHLATTTNSVYTPQIFSSEDINYQLEDLDDLLDEVGEADDDKATVGIESEEYSLDLEGVDITKWYEESDEDRLYAPLELSPNEMYMNSLLETEIDVARPYDSKSRIDAAGIPFYEVSYYNAGSVDEMTGPEGEETELEALFTATTTSVEDSEPDEEPNYNQKGGNLEARLGFGKN